MNGFMIRKSALKDGKYYIDFFGDYTVEGISKRTRITENDIHHAYQNNKGDYDSERHVYYFPEYSSAAEAAEKLGGMLKPSQVTRSVELTGEEIEYIRKALINEDSNIIFTNSRIRSSIFDKLNG